MLTLCSTFVDMLVDLIYYDLFGITLKKIYNFHYHFQILNGTFLMTIALCHLGQDYMQCVHGLFCNSFNCISIGTHFKQCISLQFMRFF